jgi:anti-sigma factor RsiW
MEAGMSCERWRSKLDAYVDGELDSAESNALGSHLPACAGCASDVLGRVQMKRSVHSAGTRYAASAELRNRIGKTVATQGASTKPPRRRASLWTILAFPALSVLVLSVAVNFYVRRENSRQERVYSELADLHVAALAGTSPVDVVSTDRHTVKPWFQGKIPFSFNLPELQGSEFTLLGGRVAYFQQAPGAHLIYQVRKHEISVFIFQDRGEASVSLPSGPGNAVSFNVQSWTQTGLRYFVVGDVGAEDISALSKLLQDAH